MRKGERGFSLLEVVIAIGVLGILVAAFIPAMMGATKFNISTDERETANNLAEREIEYVKSQPYAPAYSSDNYSADYPGFSVDPITVIETIANRDSNIQAVTVVVRRNGLQIVTLAGYKMQ